MKGVMKIISAACIVSLLTACISQITTKNSLISSVYVAKQSEVVDAFVKVVHGMENYSINFKTGDVAIVKYNPPGLFMGSASVRVNFAIASGMTSDGQNVTGTELVYTDVTPLMSQDTTFSGADIIVRLKSSFDEYMEFEGVKQYRIQRLTE